MTVELWNPRAIGGSSAASVLGVSPYASRLSLYERLRGGDAAEVWAREERMRLAAGKALEPIIADAAREVYGVEFDALGSDIDPVVHSADRRIVGHLDGILRGGAIGAEFKLTGTPRGWGEVDSDVVPLHYAVQCAHYMEVCDVDEWHLFALRTPSLRLDRYILRRKRATGKALIDAELQFLRDVDRGVPPDPAEEAEMRRVWFAGDAEQAVETTDDVNVALLKRWVAGQAMSRLQKVQSDCNAVILGHMRTAGQLLDEQGNVLLTAKANRFFDEDAFCAHYPDLAAQHMKLDRTSLQKAHRAEYERHMRPPRTADESVRVLRATPTFRKSAERLVAGEACALPFVPEIDWRNAQEEGDG